jgi:hypothetical protein
VGTWLETRGSDTNYTFLDDFTADTTGGEPANAFRAYRFIVENPQ